MGTVIRGEKLHQTMIKKGEKQVSFYFEYENKRHHELI